MARHSSIMVSRTLYQIGIITLVTAILWVLIGIYLAASKTNMVDVDKSILEPINPNLDQAVIQKLTERLKVEIVLAPTTEGSESALINVIETPISISSESATILEGGKDELAN